MKNLRVEKIKGRMREEDIQIIGIEEKKKADLERKEENRIGMIRERIRRREGHPLLLLVGKVGHHQVCQILENQVD